ncbi:hypothetical protein AB0M47_04135 [Hamadaea sp. NPDC051192]|uniref:hypothetical protein n=1 Tax=Hamadaea sp. NPDC051192 TaxID=3154940 RepID=UPI0034189235
MAHADFHVALLLKLSGETIAFGFDPVEPASQKSGNTGEDLAPEGAHGINDLPHTENDSGQIKLMNFNPASALPARKYGGRLPAEPDEGGRAGGEIGQCTHLREAEPRTAILRLLATQEIPRTDIAT